MDTQKVHKRNVLMTKYQFENNNTRHSTAETLMFLI